MPRGRQGLATVLQASARGTRAALHSVPFRMTNSRLHVVVLAIVASLIASCSAGGGQPSVASSAPSAAATHAPAATGATATSGGGVITPQTFDPNATPRPTPQPTPLPTPQPPGLAALIYAVVGQFGRPDWCDPDFYPVARADEVTVARQHLSEMQADPALFATILQHNGITNVQQLTDQQVVFVYRDWKILTKAVTLTPVAGGYSFDYIALPGGDVTGTDRHVAGTITATGQITTTVDEPTTRPNCPICLARGTLIATPAGQIPVEQMKVGDIVWSADASGRPFPAVVLEVGSTPVPATHEVVHLVLADGRSVDVSPGHPLADGREVGSLHPGDQVDGSTVLSAELVTYSGGATFDLLPAGPTGAYWANDILVGSTLHAR